MSNAEVSLHYSTFEIRCSILRCLPMASYTAPPAPGPPFPGWMPTRFYHTARLHSPSWQSGGLLWPSAWHPRDVWLAPVAGYRARIWHSAHPGGWFWLNPYRSRLLPERPVG